MNYAAFTGFSVNPEIHLVYDSRCPHTKITVLPCNFKIFAGGSAYNIQVAISKAGLPSKLFAALGSGGERPDIFREVMEIFLDTLDVQRLWVRKQDSSISLVLHPTNERRRMLSCKTPIIPEKTKENIECITTHLATCEPEFVILTGLMPDELELAEPFLKYTKGKRVLSPHVDLIQSGGLTDILPQINYLFLNGFESETILGKKPTLDTLQKFTREHKLEFVSVTTPTHGVLVATSDDRFQIPSIDHPDPVVDTTGAGDAFLAGVIIAILKGNLSARTSALYGCCHARLACTIEGSANLPPWPKVEELVQEARKKFE